MNKPQRGKGASQTDRHTREGERLQKGLDVAKDRAEREGGRAGRLPSHIGVLAPQALRGGGCGLHAGGRLVEGVASWLLGLDATSSPAFTVSTLGDVLEVPTAQEGLGARSWPLHPSAASCSSPAGISAPAECTLPPIPLASSP